MAVLCSNCSGKLIFNPASQQLECAACGSKFYPEDVLRISMPISIPSITIQGSIPALTVERR